MTKRTLALFMAVACALCMTLAACGGQDAPKSDDTTAVEEEVTTTETSEAEETADESGERGGTDGAIWSEDGIDIRNVEVNLMGSTFNFSVTFANHNSTDKEFDCSKFTIVKGDEIIQPTTSTKTLDADQTYIQWAFPISNPGTLAVDDEVEINYGETLLVTTTVEDF